jgi:hypothetical protein
MVDTAEGNVQGLRPHSVASLRGGGHNVGATGWAVGSDRGPREPLCRGAGGRIFLALFVLAFAGLPRSLGVARQRPPSRPPHRNEAMAFLGSTLLAAALGLIAVILVRPGSACRRNAGRAHGDVCDRRVDRGSDGSHSIRDTNDREHRPRNPIRAAADMDLLGSCSSISGAARRALPRQARPMLAGSIRWGDRESH